VPGNFTYYTLLGVTPNATQAEIKSAYRAAVAKYHPDVNQALNAENLTTLLNEAWSVLQDPVKKAEYDASLQAKHPEKKTSPAVSDREQSARQRQFSAMLCCEKCGEEDVYQRFAVFYRVYSLFFYVHRVRTAMRLCTQCRSREACASAFHTALFGFWGNLFGMVSSVRALFHAIMGGYMDKKANVAMLGYLANAYAERGQNEAAMTALVGCYGFQRSKGIADAIQSFKEAGIKAEPQPAWIDGQIYAMVLAFIPLILLVGVYTMLYLYWLHLAGVYHAQINHLRWSVQQLFKHFNHPS
jgi:DnaJ-domain-containing protein 1